MTPRLSAFICGFVPWLVSRGKGSLHEDIKASLVEVAVIVPVSHEDSDRGSVPNPTALL